MKPNSKKVNSLYNDFILRKQFYVNTGVVTIVWPAACTPLKLFVLVVQPFVRPSLKAAVIPSAKLSQQSTGLVFNLCKSLNMEFNVLNFINVLGNIVN